MKKFFIYVIIVLMLFISTINASVGGNYTAFCVGTDYGFSNIDTTLDAQLVATNY